MRPDDKARQQAQLEAEQARLAYRTYLRSLRPLARALIGLGISPERTIDLLVTRDRRPN
jgi:hypothetical protein